MPMPRRGRQGSVRAMPRPGVRASGAVRSGRLPTRRSLSVRSPVPTRGVLRPAMPCGCRSATCATPSCVCFPTTGTSPWSCLRTRPSVSSASAGTCCSRCAIPTCARRPAARPNGYCSNSSVRLPATFFRPPPLRLPLVFPPRVPAFVPMTRRPLSDAVPLFSVPSAPAPDRTELVIGTGVHEQYTPEYRALTRDFYLKF